MSVLTEGSYGIRLGSLLVFALILPGCVGFGICFILFKSTAETMVINVTKTLTTIFMLGFVGSTVGHFLDILIYRRFINKDLKGYPFKIYTHPNELIRFYGEYHFWWFCFLFNSATLIFIEASFFALKLMTQPIKLPNTFDELEDFAILLSVYILALMCLITAHWVAKNLVLLSKENNKLTKETSRVEAKNCKKAKF